MKPQLVSDYYLVLGLGLDKMTGNRADAGASVATICNIYVYIFYNRYLNVSLFCSLRH